MSKLYPQKNKKAGAAKEWKKQTDYSAEQLQPDDRIVVTIKRIGINGEGVGYYKRKAVFIEGALPNEVVRAKVIKADRGFIQAEMVELEKKSADRQPPPCHVYDKCGGCQLQHLSYEAQLQAKEELVVEAFRRYTSIEAEVLPLRPIIGMEEPWGYRNKAQLQTGIGRNGSIITGLYELGSRELVDIAGCPIQQPIINEVIEAVKQIIQELNIPIYNDKTRRGNIRTIIARADQKGQEVQLTIVTAEDRLTDSKRFVEAVRKNISIVTSISHNINKGKGPLVFGEKTILLWGKERLGEQLGKLKFALSPRAFFQLNPKQTIKLYNAVKEAASLKGDELVVDSYCGTGTIGLWLAAQAQEVRGIEVIAEAVRDARENAAASGINNARFYEGRAERLLPEWIQQGIRPDIIVADPPRTGCEPEFLQAIIAAKPKKFIYVSCNPSTLAKDCKVLLENGFELKNVQPVDMFPQTSHVECVILMVRKE